jgi:tetratricopeptide (TPR) repeat protein
MAEAQRANAGTFRYTGKLREALDAYLTAFELDQASDRAAVAVGNAVWHLGRPDLALRWYDKAVHRQSRPGIYAEFIGDAWSDLGEDARAEGAFRTAITFRPDLSGAAIGLARLALLNRQFEGARQQCHEAQGRFQGDWELQLFAAEIEFYARNFDSARLLYGELAMRHREGEPAFAGSIRFLSALGFIDEFTGHTSDGRALLREARALDLKELDIAPGNPRLLYSLAAGTAALGEKDEALRILQKAVEAGWIDHRSLSLDPRFDSIRDAQQYKEIFLHLTDKLRSMNATAAGRVAAGNYNQNRQER